MRVPAVMKEALKDKLKGKLSGEEVDELCKGTSSVMAQAVVDGWFSSGGLKKEAAKPQPDQVRALLDDVDRLEKEKAELVAKVERVSRMSESELVQGWIRKYDLLRGSLGKGEFDQS